MVTFGDTPQFIARLSLAPLARRVAAARDRARERLHEMAALLAAITNAPHYKPKKPIKADDLIASPAKKKVSYEGFRERERRHYERQARRLLDRPLGEALAYLTSRRGREIRLLREAVDVLRQDTDDAALYEYHRALIEREDHA